MFFRDKKINMKYSHGALVLEVFAWLLLVGLLVYVMQLYSALGDMIAATFGSDGSVLEYKPKQVVLMQPIIAVFVYVVLTGIGIVFRRAVVPGESYPVLERVLLAMLGEKCVYLIYKIGKSYFVLNELPTPLWLTIVFAFFALLIAACAAYSCIKCRKQNEN